MSEPSALSFDQPELGRLLEGLSDSDLDELPFGVIGFGSDAAVKRYNATESKLAGLARDRVIGHNLFTIVAPCMNNFMVAQRFEDASALKEPLDFTMDYVLTLRMRPQKVKLRLIAGVDTAMRFVLVSRSA